MGRLARALLGGGIRYDLQGGNFSDSGPGGADIRYRVNADEEESYAQWGGASYIAFNNWIVPAGMYSTHYIRATKNSGDVPDSGTLGSWEALSTARMWQLSLGGAGSKTCNLTIEIATDSGGSNIVDSATVILTATAS